MRVRNLIFFFCFYGIYSVSAQNLLINNEEIWHSLLEISVANKVSEDCDSINARKLKGLMALLEVKNVARRLGYSDEEISEFVNSEVNRKNLAKQTDKFLKDSGVDLKYSDEICNFGIDEIDENTQIGSLLRIKN